MKFFVSLSLVLTTIVAGASAQTTTGSVAGAVTLENTGEPVHGAVVLLIGLGQFTTTDGDGRYVIEGVPPGTYQLLVEREHLTADRRDVTVAPGESVEVDVSLSLSPIHEQVTVTTSARGESTALEQFNAITTLDSFDLSRDMWGNIGEALQNEAGVAKRSFGPASSRPIIRGFDGDRVLIMQDGTRTGDLSSQSADHNVTIDPANLERIEIIKGPATLLYGSNAVGGIVNTISPQDSFRRSQPQGMRGQIVVDGGSANAQLGGNTNFRYGSGDWMAWGSGGTRRTSDYDTPDGKVENSESELSNASVGAGYYRERAFVALGYGIEDGRFGIPGAAEIAGEDFLLDNDQRRQNLRVDLGLQNLDNAFLDSGRFIFQRVDWNHQEVEIEDGVESIGTMFSNDIYLLRAEFEQKQTSNLVGRFGVWYKNRDYSAVGDEALAPRTKQNTFAGFAYEELDLSERLTLSFGGRVEVNDYNPEMRDANEPEAPPSIPRSFTGLSAAAGLRFELAATAALVGNVTRSYRAPALEELYNYGPHLGNLAFEIGNPNLERERVNGIDLGIKGRTHAVDADLSFFYYDIGNFVFPFFENEILDGLRVARFAQDDARFTGFDAQANFRVAENLWLKAGFGYVDAKLTALDESVPRIPPFHGRVEIEIPYERITLTPELVWSASQDEIFSTGETPTDGYVVVNVKAQYTLPRTHQAHIFAVNAYNLTNERYRMHTSFIKDFAPEIGRGIKFTYSLRFF